MWMYAYTYICLYTYKHTHTHICIYIYIVSSETMMGFLSFVGAPHDCGPGRLSQKRRRSLLSLAQINMGTGDPVWHRYVFCAEFHVAWHIQ